MGDLLVVIEEWNTADEQTTTIYDLPEEDVIPDNLSPTGDVRIEDTNRLQNTVETDLQTTTNLLDETTEDGTLPIDEETNNNQILTESVQPSTVSEEYFPPSNDALIEQITTQYETICNRSAIECQALIDQASGEVEITFIDHEEEEDRIEEKTWTLCDDPTHLTRFEVHTIELHDNIEEFSPDEQKAIGTGTTPGSGETVGSGTALTGSDIGTQDLTSSSNDEISVAKSEPEYILTILNTLILSGPQPTNSREDQQDTDNTSSINNKPSDVREKNLSPSDEADTSISEATLAAGTTITSTMKQSLTIKDLIVQPLTTQPEGFGWALIWGLELGSPDDHLIFSHPVQITIPVDSQYEWQTLQVFVHHHGDEDFGTIGLATDPNAQCLEDGTTSQASNLVPVIDGAVTFYTCGASTFILDPDTDSTDEATLWLKADAWTNCTTDGCDISWWDEQSWNPVFAGNQPVQNNAARRPTYWANVLNFNPVINFDTSWGQRQRVQTNNVTTTSLLGANRDEGSYYLVSTPTSTDILQHWWRTRIKNNQARLGKNTYINYGQTLSVTQAELMTFNRNGSAYNAYINWIQTWVGTNAWVNNNQNSRLRVGRVAAWYLDGSIAELIIYNESHSITEREVIQSYLWLKYGITLNSAIGDYASSSDTSIYQIDGTYQDDIAGIWRDDSTTLDQRISNSINTTSQLTIATDNDFTSVNWWGRTQLMDWQFLIRWDNGNSGTTTQTSELDTGTYDSRIIKEWKIENTGTVWTMAIQINSLPTLWVDQYYALLTDGDSIFSAWETPLITWSTNWVFTGVIFAAGVSYFTIALETITTPLSPTALVVSGSMLDEEQSAWTIVWWFITTDPNTTDTHTYALTGWVGNTDNTSFSISWDQLMIIGIADFETQSSYSIRVRTTDQWGLFYEEVLTITINDTADAVCGDWVIENAETCDDSNTTSWDGCDSSCQVETGWYCGDISLLCGNGAIDEWEECDDGNATSWDGCSSICSTEVVVDFSNFTGESLNAESGDDSWVDWAADRSIGTSGFSVSVLATTNPYPSVLYSDTSLWSTSMPKSVQLWFSNAGDDDFIGFTIWWEPWDFSNPSADYLLITWKDVDQFFDFNDTTSPIAWWTAQAGLAISRVQWVIGWDEIWQLTDYAWTTWTISELARWGTYGNIGYAWNVSGFTFLYSTTSLDVYVNWVVDISLTWSFTDGRFGIYVFAQQGNTFTFAETNPYSVGGACYGICGDGVQLWSETCDDSNTTAWDGCNEYCQVELANECTWEWWGNNCNINATCTDTYEGFTCACIDGYTGDGVSCSDGTNSIPTDIVLSWSTSLPENQLTWTPLGILTSTDGDVTDTHTYTFGCVPAWTDDGFFSFWGASGDTLQSNSIFDFETPLDANTDNIYEICILTTDSQWGSYEENFSITISNVDEQLYLTNLAWYSWPSLTVEAVPQVATVTLSGAFGIQDSINTASWRYTTLQLVSFSWSTSSSLPLTNFLIQEADSPEYVSGDVTGLIDIGASFSSQTQIVSPLTYLKRDTTATNPLLVTEYTTNPTVQITIPSYQPVDTYTAQIEYTLYEM